jgi:hypothetical protein
VSNIRNFGLAEADQVEAISKEWARVFGKGHMDGPRELFEYTGRTDPARLTKVEARLYLSLVGTRKTFAAAPPLTDDQLAARVRRL